ncbi:MAG: DDE-type integrase/transposase/recombinase [Bradyrhizobiaceae bacterium]|nr:DDE-type integrase/transposase/recombinase [Bradyrhizobiaceae bacterium]
MNRLSKEGRAQILHLLCEGQSIRAITRLTGASKNTVAKLLIDAGRACSAYQDRVLRNLTSKRVQVDEIWSFTYAKQANVKKAKAAPEGAGDIWTWTAIDADTKLLINWLAGSRDTDTALLFLNDLRSRVEGRFQLTSDGWRAYTEAVDTIFGDDVDYAMLVKIYGPASGGSGRYSPPECIGARKMPRVGNPDEKAISTSFAERHNLTMRMHIRRFTRLTNAFSKKVENHIAAVSLHSFYYNFVRVHKTLKTSPAMAAGVTDRLWEIGDLVDLLDAWEAKEKRDAAPIFEVCEWKIGGGFYVRATLPGQEPERIEGFATEAEAARWIRNESKPWIFSRRSTFLSSR